MPHARRPHPHLHQTPLNNELTIILDMLNTRLKALLSTNQDALRKLLVRTPKNVTNDLQAGLLSRIFEQSKKYFC